MMVCMGDPLPPMYPIPATWCPLLLVAAYRPLRFGASRSDRLLELLGRAEGDLLAGLDLDRLAGCRIAPHPGGARAHLENPEAGDADLGALLQMFREALHEIAQHRLDLTLWQIVSLGQPGCHLLQADRRGRGTV